MDITELDEVNELLQQIDTLSKKNFSNEDINTQLVVLKAVCSDFDITYKIGIPLVIDHIKYAKNIVTKIKEYRQHKLNIKH